jgi:hypothetical protein
VKDSRYRVDLSKRINGRKKGDWLVKAKSIGGKLVIIVLAYFAIAYPWDKYHNEYLPLIDSIKKERTEIAKVSVELDKANKKVEALSKRYKVVTAVQKQRISWTKKLFNITKLIPSQVHITEIGLRETKGQTQKKSGSAALKTIAQKSVYLRGLIPPLKKGEYLAKIVDLTKKINTDPEFAKDLYPMYLNYNKLVNLKQGEKEQKMIEFELEAETK